ncbi:MAG: hypothetical protein H0V81_15420 [Solirubrobacterales bacterium]|nr:hypothetical protein [Solirubrobacterales bacterium]
MDSHLITALISIPLFMGAIGFVTNQTGVWMIFWPLTFKGVRVPGLKTFSSLLPRRVQQVPGIMQGGVGWQGIIPSRAAKMGSIAVDKGIAKLGGAKDFYQQLEPEAIAEHILVTSERDIRELVERIMQRENPLRLGLIWFSREALADPLRYQVLEAQPRVGESLAKAGRGRTVRRSIMLTPFGEDFCSVCLPENVIPALEA